VTDAQYRESFFEPLAEHMAASLSARDISQSVGTINVGFHQ
jgi:hypothetical protein